MRTLRKVIQEQENGSRATTIPQVTRQTTTSEKKEQQLEVFQVHKKYLEDLEKEDKEDKEMGGNRMPLFRYIVRPDTHPLFAPIFKDMSEQVRWQHEQWRLNQEYSSIIHDERVAVWEKKNNWFPVPPMTEMTEAQKKWDFSRLVSHRYTNLDTCVPITLKKQDTNICTFYSGCCSIIRNKCALVKPSANLKRFTLVSGFLSLSFFTIEAQDDFIGESLLVGSCLSKLKNIKNRRIKINL